MAAIGGRLPPADDVQGATAGSFGAEAVGEPLRWLARRHIAGRLQLVAGPAGDQPELHLVPDPIHRRTVQIAVAVAHHDAIGLHHKLARRRVVRRRGRRLLGLHIRGACPFAALQLRPHPFSVRAERLGAHRYAGQLRQQARRLREGRQAA